MAKNIMGTGVSFIYSAIATLLPNIFPSTLKNADGTVPVYFEAASVIIILVLLGQILELKARERTGGAIKALLWALIDSPINNGNGLQVTIYL